MSDPTTTTPPAAHQFLLSPLLTLLYPYLPAQALPSLLLVSHHFHLTTLPYLYSALSVRSPAPFLASSSSSPSKRSALSHVRTLRIYSYPFDPASAPPPPFEIDSDLFPHLERVHFAGGSKPPEWPCLSQPTTCPLSIAACKVASTLLVRTLDTPLPPLPALTHLIIKLRPCQLPMSFYHAARLVYPPALLSSIERVETVDLVWWDEAHDYRVDEWHPPRPSPATPSAVTSRKRMGFWNGEPRPKRDCHYCNQEGCVRTSPDAGTQMPELLAWIGKLRGIKRVGVWNWQETAKEQWVDGRVDVQVVKSRMERAAKGLEWETTGDGDGQWGNGVKVDFHGAEEYYERARGSWEIDAREQEYWAMLLEPSEEVLGLRQKLADAYGEEWVERVGVRRWSKERLRENVAAALVQEAESFREADGADQV